jgi:hypothetical protein
MRSVMRHVAAAVALVALLACSSVGTCWLRLTATSAHDCCEQDTAMKAPPRPCGSTAASVAPVELAPPVLASAVPVDPPHVVVERSTAAAFAPGYRVLVPPLILRI